MERDGRIERALDAALADASIDPCPPGLVAAVRDAVFPGGARIRPRLCLAVADACGEDRAAVSDAAAAAVELLHCASLVHDDLPCFDDSPLRRGRPSVHQAHGERLAVLAGDALIVMAFQALVRGAADAPERLPALTTALAQSVGMPGGLVAGQAWECEPQVPLAEYQRAKTAALFAAATVAGAAATGMPADDWRALGERIGAAYQVVDDIRDAAGDSDAIGKPTGQDIAHGRPSTTRERGVAGAVRHYQELMAGVVEAIPPCPGAAALESLILAEASQFIPADLAVTAA